MNERSGFSLRAFGCTLHFSASSPAGENALAQSVFPSLPRLSHNFGGDVRLHVQEAASGFTVLVNEAPAGACPSEAGLGLCIIRALDDAVIAGMRGLRAVHAGAVAWHGCGILLPGKTHAGKSSLVAELVRRGATYYSDEYALIDGEGRLHPYPRPLLLRHGSPEQTPVTCEELGGRTGRGSVPVRCI